MSSSNSNNTESSRHRLAAYVGFALLLTAGGILLNDFHWVGSVHLHTVLESIATLLALLVGAMALIRYSAQQDAKFLYIGYGFLGTGVLDAYHTLVTSVFFSPMMINAYAHLVPWSWSASRMFLSGLMAVSWWLWFVHRQNVSFIARPQRVFWVTLTATFACFLLFTVVPLPAILFENATLHRPFELVSALLFLIALIGYLSKGMWREDDFEHWLVLSLIVGLAVQSIFMPFSAQLHDTEFNLAHLFKKLSYLLVLIGLLASLLRTYQQLRLETDKRIILENSLREEAEILAKNERRYRFISNYSYDWETWYSADNKLIYISPSCERITGYTAEEFLSGRVGMVDIISPKERVSVAQHFMHTNHEEPAEELDFRITTKSGEERWISHICQPVYDEYGQFCGRRASNRDVTDRKLVEIESHAMSTALHYTPVSVVITDQAGNIEYVNPKFVEITGYSQDEVLGKNPRVLKSGAHPKEFYIHMWSVLTSGATWTGEIQNKRRDGSLYWEHAAISPIPDTDGQPRKYVAVKQEITAKKEHEAQLYQRANYDALTGLPNRALFNDRLEVALKKVARNKESLALMLLDLDHFKAVNDTHGHDAGDDLLRQAAVRLQQCVRETDTVGRLGGDEFIILLENLENNTAREVSQRIVSALAKPFEVLGNTCHVSASVGVVLSTPSFADKELLVKSADMGLYEAKGRGRNQAVYVQENGECLSYSDVL
ncbi:MAG: hypothetical protein CVU29_06675 [Betaproteobacteria bacterium HGW-Betaproteobacteria-22]|nr:MAG: hypothetical protein CVU29_06675 [Betaproteobacteria bacterium HGW-Betaproteobacteria-22]